MAKIEKEKLKMVICAERELAESVSEGFESAGFISVGCVCDPSEAIKLVQKKGADLIIMEPYLAGMNCDELTDRLEKEASPLLVKLVISERRQDLMAARFHSCGGDLFRLPPLDYAYTASRILALREERRSGFANLWESPENLALRDAFSSILRKIGMRVSRKGFCYIIDAAIICLQEPDVFKDFRRDLYPIIANRRQSNGFCVERCIRIAIEELFKSGDPELIYNVFHPDAQKGKVPNKEFIACLIELYRERELKK